MGARPRGLDPARHAGRPLHRAGGRVLLTASSLSNFFDLFTASWGPGASKELLSLPRPGGGARVSVSGQELRAEVTALGSGLAAYGLRPGDPVALISGDEAEIWIGELAVLACGGCCVPVDPSSDREILLGTMRASKARFALVSSAPILARVLEVRPELPDLEMILLFREPRDAGAVPATLVLTARSLGLDRLSADPRLLERARAGIQGPDSAYIVVTRRDSETRVVRLSHDNLVAATRAVAEAFPLTDDDRALSRLPLLQVARRPWHAALISRGATLVYVDPGAAAHEQLEALRPTLIVGEGDDLDELLRHLVGMVLGRSPLARVALAWARRRTLDVARQDLAGGRLPDRSARAAVLERIHRAAGGRLRWIVSVARPLGARRLTTWLGTGIPVLEGIGTPTTTGVLCQNLPTAVRMGSSGRVLPGNAVRVDDAGQIWLRGPIVEHAQSTGRERTVSDRSWFRTGLVGRQDDDGYITVV